MNKKIQISIFSFWNICLFILKVIKGYFSPLQDESNYSIDRLEFLLREALDEDEDNNSAEALSLYMEAVETGLKIVKSSFF